MQYLWSLIGLLLRSQRQNLLARAILILLGLNRSLRRFATLRYVAEHAALLDWVGANHSRVAVHGDLVLRELVEVHHVHVIRYSLLLLLDLAWVCLLQEDVALVVFGVHDLDLAKVLDLLNLLLVDEHVLLGGQWPLLDLLGSLVPRASAALAPANGVL